MSVCVFLQAGFPLLSPPPPTHARCLLSRLGHSSRLITRESHASDTAFDSGVGAGLKECKSEFSVKFNVICSLFLALGVITIMLFCGQQ